MVVAGAGGVLLTATAHLLGLARFAFGGITAPLVGLAGAETAVPLGIVAVTAALLSLAGYALVRP